MKLVRLLVAVPLLAVSIAAQNSQSTNDIPSKYPLELVPAYSQQKLGSRDFSSELRSDSQEVLPTWQDSLDTTCYRIRSYVVARDSKDSDSTHLVGYSTCRPASRYRLKTTHVESEHSR